MQLHLDIEGTMSGDMFAAALLDTFPHLEPGVLSAVDTADARHPVVCSLLPVYTGTTPGLLFKVEPFTRHFGAIPLAFPDDVPTWSTLRESLLAVRLPEGICRHAIRMFQLFAEAESFAEGIPAGAVEFRKIGAWAAMAEIVAAAAIIDSLGPVRWTISAARDFDHMRGTAPAILRYLCPFKDQQQNPPLAGTIDASGTGFGADLSAGGSVRVACCNDGVAEVARQTLPTQHSSSGLSGHQ
jgi:hypothetical protein